MAEDFSKAEDLSKIEDFSEAEDFSKIEDFSQRITRFEGPETAIFWDVEDYPFPVNLDPDLIYENIKSALTCRGWRGGRMSIWAYVDEKKGSSWCKFLHKKTWKSRLYFLPGGGDKLARRNRMFHDIFLWRMDIPLPACLLVVSDKVRCDKGFFYRLGFMNSIGYSVYLVEPSQPTEKTPLGSPEWPVLIFDEAYLPQNSEGSRKKHKVVAEEGSEDQG